jgi:ABC-type nitrate/sulfonate/bicarbonate transport system permease component
VVLGSWEVAPRVGLVRPTLIPPFSTVMAELRHVLADPDFLSNFEASARRWAVGFSLAILIGVGLGIVMGRSRIAFFLIDPVVTMSYPVPRAALILILVLWFGVGLTSMSGIIVLGTSIPLIISSYHGAKGVRPNLIWQARALGTSRLRALIKVVLPAALPQVLSGLRIAIAVSLFTLLASELLIRQSGIGAQLFINWDNAQYAAVWAYSVILATIGFGLDFIYVRLVRWLLPWLEGQV